MYIKIYKYESRFADFSLLFCFVYEVAMNAGYDCHIFLVKYFSYHIKFY